MTARLRLEIMNAYSNSVAQAFLLGLARVGGLPSQDSANHRPRPLLDHASVH